MCCGCFRVMCADCVVGVSGLCVLTDDCVVGVSGLCVLTVLWVFQGYVY